MTTPKLASLTQPIPNWSEILTEILQSFDCQTGTLHQLNPGTDLLDLLAQQGIPEFLLDKVNHIPIGKGIAGCAAQRLEPVQLCNLQTDTSGVARPDAKQTKVEGAIAVPILGPDNRLRGVLGIGKMTPYDFTDAEITDLQMVAARLVEGLAT